MNDNCKSSTERYCRICERYGQFLPVRIGIALAVNSSEYLKPSSSILKDLPVLPDKFVYILRRLNEGFIYVYANDWIFKYKDDIEIKAYQVRSNGYIKEIDKDEMIIDSFEEKCFYEDGPTTKGQNISNAFLLELFSRSGDVGVLYTRHQLSDLTCQKLTESQNDRNRIMHQFNTKKGGEDFLVNKSEIFKLFDNSLNKNYSCMPWEESVLKVVGADNTVFGNPTYLKDDVYWVHEDKTRTRFEVSDDRVIIMHDPVGLMEELHLILDYYSKIIMSEVDNVKLQSANNILHIKNIIYKSKYIEGLKLEIHPHTGKVMDDEQRKMNNNPVVQAVFSTAPKISNEKMINAMKNADLKAGNLNRIQEYVEEHASREWEKLSKKINEEEMENFLKECDSSILIKYTNEINPLERLYVELWGSDILFNYMDVLFDHSSMFSSKNYLNVFVRIYQKAECYELISKHVDKLLEEDNFNNKRNYIFKVMALDNDSLQAGISSLTNFAKLMKFSEFSENMIKFYDKSLVNQDLNFFEYIYTVRNSVKNNIDIISDLIGGSVARATTRHLNKINGLRKYSLAMKSFELFTGNRYLVKEYSGNLKKITYEIMHDLDLDYSNLSSRLEKKNLKNNIGESIMNSLKSHIEKIDNNVINSKSQRVYMATLISDINLNIFDLHNKSMGEIQDVFQKKVIFKEDYLYSETNRRVDSYKVIHDVNSLKLYNTLVNKTNTQLVFFSLNLNGFLNALEKFHSSKVITKDEFISLVDTTTVMFSSIAELIVTLQKPFFYKTVTQVDNFTKIDEIFFRNMTNNKSAGLIEFSKKLMFFAVIITAISGLNEFSKKLQKGQYIQASMVFVSTGVSIINVLYFSTRLAPSIILIVLVILIEIGIRKVDLDMISNFLEHSTWGKKSKKWNSEKTYEEFKKLDLNVFYK